MPDPTYKTFLSPGSCQLEITDLVAAANDDNGVDLYGVAWEIEQVIMAGEGFAASPTDVWVNERGILNVGQSLFDKINRTALNNTNIPGQCTVVVKATSLVDSSKVARLKVLVGYPGEGGGGGGGGEPQTTDVYLWNATVGENSDVLPTSIAYLSSYEEEEYTQLQFEPITAEDDEENTFYGVKVKDCPVGALFNNGSFVFTDVEPGYISFYYSDVTFDVYVYDSSNAACPMPLDGAYVIGGYTVVSGGEA